MPRFMRAVQATAEYWAWSIRLNNYFSAVGYAILFYDFSLTFSTEVEYFWKSANISLFSVLFAANRYFGLLGPIPTIFEYFTSPSEQRYIYSLDLSVVEAEFFVSCRNLQVYHQAFAVASQATIAIILVLRTYALYERSGRILVLLIVTHVGGAIAALVMMITTESPKDIDTTLPFNFSGCDLSLTNGQSFHLAIAWFAMLWFDTTIFVLTLARAIQMHRRLPGGIVEILFRDGTIYYGIIVASTVTNIATFLATPSGSNLKGLETTLTNTLSTTLISRLILNLRDTRLRRARYIGEGANSQALSATSAQSVVSRVVFGRDQAKALSTSASDSTSCTDFPNDTEMTA